MPDFEKYNELHHNSLEKDLSYLENLYDEFIDQVAAFVSLFKVKDVFKFQNTAIKEKFSKSLRAFYKKQQDSIDILIDKHYNLSNDKNDLFLKNVLKNSKIKPKPEYYRNSKAAEQFRKRRYKKYSKKVWDYSKQFQQELEMAIDTAIKDGTPANKLAAEIKRHLKAPENLFRRYRDNNGQLKLSKNALAYNPGQGVYRSSFKNAQRLARTEINRAYRLADIERWQAMDFVIGYEVKRSNNPFPCSVCESLKGKYPKTFIFGGWHPNCRCFLVPILASIDDFVNEKAPPQINKAPQFDKWVADNADRINRAKSLPYFLRDNREFWEKGNDIAGKLKTAQKKFNRNVYVSFEPFSPVIIENLRKLKHNNKKQKLLKEIVNDKEAKVLNVDAASKAKTVIFEKHRGTKSESWNETKQMAIDLNKKAYDVCFLPEYDNISSADAITKFKDKFVIADFKYSTTKKIGTLKKDLKKGFEQADCIVLKLQNGNTDLFVKAIEEMKRKGYKLGDIILINKYKKIIELNYKVLNNGDYMKIIKGHL